MITRKSTIPTAHECPYVLPLSGEQFRAGSLKLLVSSYQAGDHRAIETALFLPDDLSERHRITFDVADICVHSARPECLALMLFVYEYAPSGLRRSVVAEAMRDLAIAPAWLAEECRFDAQEFTRRAFGGPS